ncbi:ABC transporter permease [Actinocrinis sp.]|uniref:ABC transporter permease n=1 Tax=Actinocrinis sp. TaxID=1920516 RepID=UPI002D414478|nr:ABC transporter permease [Actinocrinis sp.]HZP53317.1 ABC transporter permease [Actinocrinis sp.]
MGAYLLRRLLNYVILTFVGASIAYLLAALALNPRSNYEGKHPTPSPAVITRMLDEKNLNPDTDVFVRYGHWLDDLAHGNFGTEVQGGSVGQDLARRVGVSTRLLLFATIIGAIGGVLVGAWNAVRQYRASDQLSSFASFLIISTPVFTLAILLKALAVWFNNASGTHFFQYDNEYDATITAFWPQLLSRAQHLVLPTITLVLGEIAIISRYQRSTMLDVLGSDFLRTARAKGLTRRKAIYKHGLRTAIIPVMTLLVYNTVLLFTGATFTETIFDWNGMGQWAVTSIQGNDTNAVAAVSLFVAGLVLIAGLLSEIAYAALDPRVRA